MRSPLHGLHGHRGLLTAFAIDALGTGAFIPFSLLYFRATSGLGLVVIGLGLSLAALSRIPATLAAGWLVDRLGPHRAVIGTNLLQACGFVSFLFVHSFPHLLLSALVIQIGNSVFWVAYPGLVQEAAEGRAQEPWFGIISGLRSAGLGLGGLVAGAAVALAGDLGYRLVVAGNAVSFLVAAVLVRLDRSATGIESVASSSASPPGASRRSSWASVLRHRSFLLFVLLNVGFAVLSQAFGTAAPVFLVGQVGLPVWLPGAVLGLNAAIGALGAPLVVALLRRRRRDSGLAVSQLTTALGYGCLLACAFVPAVAAVALAVCAAICITAMELIQGVIVPAVVNDSSEPAGRGRYSSVYQMAFAVSDIATPALMTGLLQHGPGATWVPLIGLAILGSGASLLLGRSHEPLRRRSGQPEIRSSGRVAELGGL